MMEAALILARFSLFSAAMLLLGGSLFMLRFRAGADGAAEIRQTVRRWYRPVLLTAGVFAVVSSLLWLDIEAGLMGDSWSDTVNPRTFDAVLLETTFGHVWMWTLSSAAVLLLVALAPIGSRRATPGTVLVVALSIVLVASSASTGHAVMHPGLVGAVHLMVQIVHVFAASVWLGSLPILGFVLRQAWVVGGSAWRDTVQYVLPRYSRTGYVAVGVILFTGCLNSWFLLDGVDAFLNTTYGRILFAKISLFVLMVGLAMINRFVLAPQILQPKANTVVADMALRRLWRTVVIEQCLGLSIIAVVSVLGTIAPAMSGHMEM
jgi:putative copper resistance protein D